MRSAGRVVAALLVLALAGLFVRLGFWQLDRLAQRRARNEAIRGAALLRPLELAPDTVEALLRAPDGAANRSARARGVYEPAGEVVLRGRIREGSPGVHLVTPLRIAGTEVRVWVNRGWVAAPDGATPQRRPAPERGEVAVSGLLQPVPRAERGGEPVPDRTGSVTYRRLDLGTLRERSPGPVLPLYLQQLPDSALSSPPFRIPPPELGEGSHLSYAVQWFSFAAIAIAGLAVLLVRGRRAGW